MTLLICLALAASQEPVASANDDYLRAAAIVAEAGDALKPVTEGNVLEWAQNATKKYGRALEWIKAGNQKPFVPLERRSLNGEFPEFAGYRAIGFLYEANVFGLIADGRPNQAADALVDALTFGRRVQSVGTIGHMIGSQIIERNLRMFDLNRRAFAEEGLEKLAKLELILAIPADKSAMQIEFLAVEGYGDLDSVPEVDRPRILAKVEQLKAQSAAQLEKNESDWTWEYDIDLDDALPALSLALEAMWPRALVVRTKLRLLNATAKVLLQEIREYKLPDSLADAYDPATGSSFFYGKRDDAFVIYSEGVERIGRVDLATLWNRSLPK